MKKSIEDMTKEERLKVLEAYKLISPKRCPEDKYRDPEHTNCFYCEDCWIHALEKSLKMDFDIK